MAANQKITARYTLRATGAYAVTEDVTPREVHGDNMGDLTALGYLSQFTCEIVDHVTGTTFEVE